MLLPSDVARLVLGYLQEEGLTLTSQAFIHESPNLKEYADHTTGDGVIPACLFSMFGKGLTTILNEYVATKAKGSSREVPLVMTALWKKVDFILNQIKSMQNVPVVSASPRTGSCVGLLNTERQQLLTLASVNGVICSSLSETTTTVSTAHSSHSLLGHSTAVSYPRQISSCGAVQQMHDGSRLLNTPRDLPLSVTVPEARQSSGPTSPGRRKWETPRKRSGALGGSSGSPKSTNKVSYVNVEPRPEEPANENFPQLVIQNARDKILGDRSLQEKLAENINKILANEPAPQTSKPSTSTEEADQSIDEILGIEGEIHMSDDAIHDILKQTESDPAFQALYELFDYHKNKCPEGETANEVITEYPEQNNSTGLSSTDPTIQIEDPGAAHKVLNVPEPTPTTQNTRTVQESKSSKSSSLNLLEKTLVSRSHSSRIENSCVHFLSYNGECQASSSASVESRRKKKSSHANSSGAATQMDIDEPLNTPPPPIDSLSCSEVIVENSSSSTKLSKSTSSKDASASLTPNAPISNGEKKQGHKRVLESNRRPVTRALSLPASALEVQSAPGGATLTPEPFSLVPMSTAETPTSVSAAATSLASSDSCYQLPTIFSSSSTSPSKAEGDPSGIISLNIIISDQQGENSCDTALNQAISSISSEKMPTIYLSSPAKTPAEVPASPKVNFDELAQAVRGLQNSEAARGLLASPLTGTSQANQTFIIQVPVDPANCIQSSTANNFFVAPTPDNTARMVLVPAGVSQGQPLTPNQHLLTSPTQSQGYNTSSALVLSSPINPVVIPISVLGQNTVANVQMVSNQQVGIPNATPPSNAKPASVENKTSATPGTEKNMNGPVSQQEASKGPNHRRILCFESSSSSNIPSQTTETISETTFRPKSIQQSEKDKTPHTKPTILSGNKPKRRIEPVRCSSDPQTVAGNAKEAGPLKTQQKEIVSKSSRKQEHKEFHDNSIKIVLQSEAEKATRLEITKSHTDRKNHFNTGNKDLRSSTTSDSALKSGSGKDKEENSGKAPKNVSLKSHERGTEKRTSCQEIPSVVANKENERTSSIKEQQPAVPSSSASRDLCSAAITQIAAITQPKAMKAPSKTSSLAKQAAEMLQNIHGLGSSSTPVKKTGACSSDRVLAGADYTNEVTSPRTPARNKGKEGEGTPRRLKLSNTPDVPTCSPASEAGSENSINMAAHTLMILSRAAISRTGSPLKDSLHLEEDGENSPQSAKITKKRKQSPSPMGSPRAKKVAKQSSRHKDKEKKTAMDCFPHDLDVDKFLSSLHYDE